MRPDDRRVKEKVIYQGVNETIAYTLTTTPWGSSPTSPSITITDSDGTDVTATVAPGSASVAGDIITLPAISSLTNEAVYRVAVQFDISGSTYETHFDLIGQE